MTTKTLRFVARDQWDRPVYEDEDGILWKDIDCREGYEDVLYTCWENDLEGDPNAAMKEDVQCIFIPERIKDPHNIWPKLVTYI